MNKLILLAPEYRERVWGGHRLKEHAAHDTPIGEAWIVYEGNIILNGAFAGQTLGEAARQRRGDVLGRAAERLKTRHFPLLIKLLDTADWLSIQVHPNDEQAAQMEGPDTCGKTEAWHVIEAAPGAKLIAGVKPGTTAPQLAQAIENGNILELSQFHDVQKGDTLFMPAGTLHAIGPGLFIYEVQQTSDITYRVFDWNRPASAHRALHIPQSVRVTSAFLHGEHFPLPGGNAAEVTLTACEYFKLSKLSLQKGSYAMDTRGESFCSITSIFGQVEVKCGGERVVLKPYETVIVAACAGIFELNADSHVFALMSSLA